MSSCSAIINELEEAVNSGSADKRLSTLRRITGLFLDKSDQLNDEQVAVFDDVLVHLIERIETKALVQLSASLAPLDNAPIEVVRSLARNDEISVAGPVLTQSTRLDESDLIEIARSKGQGHLLAMSGRASLNDRVTDILVERGDHEVAHRLVQNPGARFSNAGFERLVLGAGSDEALAEKLGLRLDMPAPILRHLLQKASNAVRARLLASATPENQEKIQSALATIVNEVGREASSARDFRKSESLVSELNRQGKLNESMLLQFAKDRKYEEMTSTLALFCQAPVAVIELLMKNANNEGVLLACKTAKLSWPTASAILQVRFSHHSITEPELADAKASFIALTQASAQRAFRFMLAQHVARKQAS